MDEFTVIGVIGETLKELMRDKLNQAFPGNFPVDGEEVTLISPKELGASHRLSFFLYHIVENPYMKNQPMERAQDNQLKYSPLCLNLYYLLTPHVETESENIKGWDAHSIIGRAMQVLYDHSSLEGAALRDLLVKVDYEDFYEKIGQVRIILNSLSLDDLTKIWNSLDTSLRLSVSYEVRVIIIESERKKEIKRIVEKNAVYYQIKGKKEEQGS
jgi:hypothetical protein